MNVVQFTDIQKQKEPFYTQCTLIGNKLTVQVMDKKTNKLIFRHTFEQKIKNANDMSRAFFAVIEFITEKYEKMEIPQI